jgi:hypothetical protein
MTEETLGQPTDDGADELDDSYGEPEPIRDAFDAPQVVAIVAFVTAVVSFAGFGLMNGSSYIAPFLTGEEQNGRLVLGLVLGAALALLPVGLGWHSASHTLDDDPAWIGTLARSAMVLGLASMALRLVVAIIQASQEGPTGFVRL